jgi:hypothetical protein
VSCFSLFLWRFYIDHNIFGMTILSSTFMNESLICQGTQCPRKNPASFGGASCLLTNNVRLGLFSPWSEHWNREPSGRLPARTHPLSPLPFNLPLRHLRLPRCERKDKQQVSACAERLVDQRINTLGQGLFLITMTPLLLHVLGLIPQSVLAELFFVTGVCSPDLFPEVNTSPKNSRGT